LRGLGEFVQPRSQTLIWRKFGTFGEAIKKGYGENKTFDYVIVNVKKHSVLYVGKASKGFQVLYRGGTHTALDAALDSSPNQVYLAKVPKGMLRRVEKQLIWDWRDEAYNIQGKRRDPRTGIKFLHRGDSPVLSTKTIQVCLPRMGRNGS
jgi:hypothetical protein